MRKKPVKTKRQDERELSDDQLEAVAGGASLAVGEIAPVEGAATDGAPSTLAAHCATGEHIPKLIIKTR